MSRDSRDLRVGAAYERARADARSDAIELRRRRRVDLGDLVSVVFESRETLAAAAEEVAGDLADVLQEDYGTRRGSLSFGKGNFKALFVSIEHEQAKRGNL